MCVCVGLQDTNWINVMKSSIQLQFIYIKKTRNIYLIKRRNLNVLNVNLLKGLQCVISRYIKWLFIMSYRLHCSCSHCSHSWLMWHCFIFSVVVVVVVVVSLVYFLCVCLCYSLKAFNPLPLLNVVTSLGGADRYSTRAQQVALSTKPLSPKALNPNH